MSIIHNFKDHILGFKMTPDIASTFLFDKVMKDYVFMPWKLISKKKSKVDR